MQGYGISTWIVQSLACDHTIAALAETGFDAIELSGSIAPVLKAWERDPAGLVKRLQDRGIRVPSVHSPVDARILDAEGEATRQAVIERNLAYLELMARSGIDELVLHAKGVKSYSSPEAKAAGRARCVNSLAAIAERAEQLGRKVAVENGIGHEGLGATMTEIRDMIDGLGAHVGLCLDVGHAALTGLDLVGELHDAGDRLFSLHLHDVNEQNRDHFIPGEGTIDWQRFLAALDATRLEVLRTLEISPPRTDAVGRLHQAAALREHWEAGK